MIQRRQRAGLALEAPLRLRRSTVASAASILIATVRSTADRGPVYLTHTASAERADDFIGAEPRSGTEHWTQHYSHERGIAALPRHCDHATFPDRAGLTTRVTPMRGLATVSIAVFVLTMPMRARHRSAAYGQRDPKHFSA